MSGHSKWATIKHKKGAADAKRGKVFTKIIKEIMVAAKLGGGDIDANPRLRTAVLKARASNMPKDNVDRAIKKGTGDLDGVDYIEIVYEAYGPGGVAIMIETLTDNKNRTAADVRSMLTKAGGNLGESGCVAYLFNRKGVFLFDAASYTEDQVLEVSLESGAQDVSSDSDNIEVTCDPDDFEALGAAFANAGFEPEMSEISLVADAKITLDNDGTRKVLRLLDILDDHDDVQQVSSNLQIPDDFDDEG